MPRVRSTDRRVQKTQDLLHGALASLIHEKSYDAIVVKEILARANVGRSTFYTHFRDKDELLEVTPESYRIRKRILATCFARARPQRRCGRPARRIGFFDSACPFSSISNDTGTPATPPWTQRNWQSSTSTSSRCWSS